MKLTDLPTGTRIYYTGDMANQDGFGTITATTTDKWGQFLDIKLDDGRTIEQLPLCCFSPEYKGHGGTRFVTIAAYNLYRQTIADAHNWPYTPAA